MYIMHLQINKLKLTATFATSSSNSATTTAAATYNTAAATVSPQL